MVMDEDDLLSVSREEAQRTVDNQIESLNDIDTKAIQIFRINIVIISIILTGVSLAQNMSNTGGLNIDVFLNGYNFVGLFCLLFSTAIAGLTYTASDQRIGLSSNDLRDILDNDYTERENLEGIISSYADWIDYNFETSVRNAPLGTLTVLFVVYAITFFSIGIIDALNIYNTDYIAGIGVIGLIFLTYRSKLHRQICRYLDVVYDFDICSYIKSLYSR